MDRLAYLNFSIGKDGPCSPGSAVASIVTQIGAAILYLELAGSVNLATGPGTDRWLLFRLGVIFLWFQMIGTLVSCLVESWNWKKSSNRMLAETYFVALSHGGPVSLLCGYLIMTKPFDLVGPNEPIWTPWALSYTGMYTIADLIVMVRLVPDEKVFMLHHIWVAVHLLTCVMVGAGGGTALVCVSVAESTNPLQCIYSICDLILSEHRQKNIDLSIETRTRLTASMRTIGYVFMVAFAFFRFFLGIPMLMYTVGTLVYQPGSVPSVLAKLWAAIISIFFIGSLSWFFGWKKQFREQLSSDKSRP